MIYTASLTCANPLRLEDDVGELMAGGIHTLHLDLMDGHHVPALGLNLDTIAMLRKAFPLAVLDAHLMVENPEAYYQRLKEAGVDWCTVVPRTTADPAKSLETIRRLGMKAGFVLNLEDEISAMEPLLCGADLVVVMTIPSGGYGRPFQPEALGRIARLAEIRAAQHYPYLISVDGGVTRERSLQCRDAGADILVEGVFTLFRQPEGIRKASEEYIRFMQEA